MCAAFRVLVPTLFLISILSRKRLVKLASVISTVPTLAGDVPADEQHKGLAASVGLITYTGPQGPAFFRGGHNDSTGNTLVCLEKGQRCVLVMSNDVRAEAAFPMIVRDILGETGTPWRWIFGDMKFV